MTLPKKLFLVILACLVGLFACARKAEPQVTLCPFLPGAGYGNNDVIRCSDAADCYVGGTLGCCIRYVCVGHLPYCGENCGQTCLLTYTCEDIFRGAIPACYKDCP